MIIDTRSTLHTITAITELHMFKFDFDLIDEGPEEHLQAIGGANLFKVAPKSTPNSKQLIEQPFVEIPLSQLVRFSSSFHPNIQFLTINFFLLKGSLIPFHL
jgi:hypothetical protein